MLKGKEQELLIKFYDWRMNRYRKMFENHFKHHPIKDPEKRREMLNQKYRLIWGTYKDLINLGVYDKQRIGKALRNLEKHGLVFVKTYKQTVLEYPDPYAGGEAGWRDIQKTRRISDKKAGKLRKKAEKNIEELRKSGLSTDNIRAHIMTKKDFPDPRERMVTMTYKGHVLIDILKGSNVSFQ